MSGLDLQLCMDSLCPCSQRYYGLHVSLHMPRHGLTSTILFSTIRPGLHHPRLQVLELLAEHLAQWSCHIAFPELSHLPLAHLRAFAKHCRVDRFRTAARALADAVQRNAAWVGRARDAVDFSPKDAAQVASFLRAEAEAKQVSAQRAVRITLPSSSPCPSQSGSSHAGSLLGRPRASTRQHRAPGPCAWGPAGADHDAGTLRLRLALQSSAMPPVCACAQEASKRVSTGSRRA